MKKLIAITLCIALVLAMAACGSTQGGNAKLVDGTLSEIFAKIYENADVDSLGTYEVPVDDTNKSGMLGTDAVSFVEGLASEAMIMTIPHSMVLLRIDENADVEKIKQLIRENVDPRKWICVGVEADQVIVDSIGDLVFLVMSENAAAYHESFLKLA